MSYETSTPAAKAAPSSRMPPPPPARTAAPPPPPAKPDVPRYKSLFNFDGQDGEMSLKKEDIVEVKEKDDNGELVRLPFAPFLDPDCSLLFLSFRMVARYQERNGRMGSFVSLRIESRRSFLSSRVADCSRSLRSSPATTSSFSLHLEQQLPLLLLQLVVHLLQLPNPPLLLPLPTVDRLLLLGRSPT